MIRFLWCPLGLSCEGACVHVPEAIGVLGGEEKGSKTKENEGEKGEMRRLGRGENRERGE